jgi:hypothetical protein
MLSGAIFYQFCYQRKVSTGADRFETDKTDKTDNYDF